MRWSGGLCFQGCGGLAARDAATLPSPSEQAPRGQNSAAARPGNTRRALVRAAQRPRGPTRIREERRLIVNRRLGSPKFGGERDS